MFNFLRKKVFNWNLRALDLKEGSLIVITSPQHENIDSLTVLFNLFKDEIKQKSGINVYGAFVLPGTGLAVIPVEESSVFVSRATFRKTVGELTDVLATFVTIIGSWSDGVLTEASKRRGKDKNAILKFTQDHLLSLKKKIANEIVNKKVKITNDNKLQQS